MEDPNYAYKKAEKLLHTLATNRYRKRIKALDDFQQYIAKYKPGMYNDDVNAFYTGQSGLGLDGLIARCGYISAKKKNMDNPYTKETLKDTSIQCLKLLYFLLNINMDEDKEDIHRNNNKGKVNVYSILQKLEV